MEEQEETIEVLKKKIAEKEHIITVLELKRLEGEEVLNQLENEKEELEELNKKMKKALKKEAKRRFAIIRYGLFGAFLCSYSYCFYMLHKNNKEKDILPNYILLIGGGMFGTIIRFVKYE
ncbi:unnamed protein product [Meloidogyne enterolobii]|uniref:Uncharacterized protein n=1 Tax=Meloidogyne enterolobii TaxID=390850 RepID=A0ACB0ZF55_MELEN